MPKLAIKTKKKILEEKVFLKRSYDGYMQYGLLELIDKREGHTNVIGKIRENLLQEDIIISYNDEIEKLKILEVIPRDFYYRVNIELQKIYISFRKESIKAHLFVNREYVAKIYKFLTCFDEEEDIILQVTLKSEELTKAIMDFKKKVLTIKKDFYPHKFMSKYQASKNIKNYIIWLMENYKVELIEENDLSEYMLNLRKYYDNSDIEMYTTCLKQKVENYKFSFIYDDKTFTVIIGSRKTGDYFEDYGGFEPYFDKFVENLKAQNDYYIEGTDTPKYEAEERIK
ncbi:MAG: hypothetical protein J6C46_12000 [Clostridia bacterium]|nr:hypothetical protein [Clostridia bacterium]